MTIRPYTDADEQALIALWREVFAYSAPHNNPAVALQRKFAVDPGLLLVAIVDDQLAGSVMGGYDGHRGWIYSLAVAPRFRRCGVGSALVRHAEQAIRARGCLKINLQILADNAQVATFYEKLGYQVEPRVSMGKIM